MQGNAIPSPSYMSECVPLTLYFLRTHENGKEERTISDILVV